MQIKYTFKGRNSTKEIADRVAELRRAGEDCFTEACLTPEDETWWKRTMTGIEKVICDEVTALETPDEDLIKEIPESAYKNCNTQKDRDRVQKDHLHRARFGKSWVLYLGFLTRDVNRVFHESILMGDRVIQARNKLRTFVAAVALETGCATLGEEE